MDRRPTRTLWEQLTAPDPAIRDWLKIPHDDDDGGEAERRPSTLMDAIGREIRGGSGGSWKPLRLRDRLGLRRAANAPPSTTTSSEEEEEESKDEAPAASMSLMALLEQADNQWDDDEEDGEGDSGNSASNCGAVVGEEEEEDEGEVREEEEEAMARACCVCTVRHKGAAFIPCGHTFCRLCSRELLLTRASCPLCNAFIHDILHIF